MASVGGIGIVSFGALAGYLLSLHVAAADMEGKALDGKLRATRQEVQQLKLEVGVRSRFVELERWGATLGLRPTVEQQYVADQQQLGAVAAARREQMLAQSGLSEFAEGACDAASPPHDLAKAGCQAGPVGGHHGYTPQARKALDSLIGDVLH